MDIAVVSVSADDNDIDCACEGGLWVDVLVVLVRGADGADCTTEVVHRRGQDHLWRPLFISPTNANANSTQLPHILNSKLHSLRRRITADPKFTSSPTTMNAFKRIPHLLRRHRKIDTHRLLFLHAFR